jgi:hypothetical protein
MIVFALCCLTQPCYWLFVAEIVGCMLCLRDVRASRYVIQCLMWVVVCGVGINWFGFENGQVRNIPPAMTRK